jgi:hypothetical protein
MGVVKTDLPFNFDLELTGKKRVIIASKTIGKSSYSQ